MNEIIVDPMTEEEIENFIMESILSAGIAGFKTVEEMNDFKVDAAEGMLRFGGSFLKFLGEALAHADDKNTMKIIMHFRKECDEHAELHREWLKERNGEGEIRL